MCGVVWCALATWLLPCAKLWCSKRNRPDDDTANASPSAFTVDIRESPRVTASSRSLQLSTIARQPVDIQSHHSVSAPRITISVYPHAGERNCRRNSIQAHDVPDLRPTTPLRETPRSVTGAASPAEAMPLHWHAAPLARRSTGAPLHWHAAPLACRSTGAPLHWHAAPLARRSTGAPLHWHAAHCHVRKVQSEEPVMSDEVGVWLPKTQHCTASVCPERVCRSAPEGTS